MTRSSLPDVQCKCPKCGKIYTVKNMRVFDYNPNRLFRKFCHDCEGSSKNISPLDIEIGQMTLKIQSTKKNTIHES